MFSLWLLEYAESAGLCNTTRQRCDVATSTRIDKPTCRNCARNFRCQQARWWENWRVRSKSSGSTGWAGEHLVSGLRSRPRCQESETIASRAPKKIGHSAWHSPWDTAKRSFEAVDYKPPSMRVSCPCRGEVSVVLAHAHVKPSVRWQNTLRDEVVIP